MLFINCIELSNKFKGSLLPPREGIQIQIALYYLLITKKGITLDMPNKSEHIKPADSIIL